MTVETVCVRREFPPQASSVGQARALIREVLTSQSDRDWEDAAELAVSELVTNALVHAGTSVHVEAQVSDDGLRVEVADGSPHRPVRRDYSSTSGTGRGLKLLDDCVSGWGTFPHGDGKVVWFELRRTPDQPEGGPAFARLDGAGQATPDHEVEIQLLNVPLLMHSAWQEHASAVLREFLLVRVEEDDFSIFEAHAQASDAMNLLYEQIPAPELGTDPEALMATALEPDVSEARMVLRVPGDSVDNFETLERMLIEAGALAAARVLLVPATQPEIRDMRSWLCGQVRDQHRGGSAPTAWRSDVDLRSTAEGFDDLADWDFRDVSGSERALLATDEASQIVAVSPSALAFLGHAHEIELLGRRVVSIVPLRYHQAHIAGTTLHMTNGRAPLLGKRITVPVVHGDGSERIVELIVDSRRLADGRRFFLAEFFVGP